MRRPARLLVALVPAVLILAACGSSADRADTGTAAPEAAESSASSEAPLNEDAVIVYSGRSEDLVTPLLEKFTTETGIAVDVRFGDTAELAAQLIEEGDASPADLYFGQDAGAMGALDAAGMCAPLPAGAADAVPALYKSESGTWTGITGRARVIAYDPTQVPEQDVPTSVFDLTDPKWKGQVAIAPTNGSFQSFVTAMRVSQGDDVTREWLQGLVDNDVQMYEKNSLIRDAVDAGEAKLGLINHYYWYQKAAEVGEENVNVQIAFAKPGDPGALVNVAGACVLTPADNAEGAAQLLSWMLTPETQKWFVDQSWEYPLVEGVAAPDGIPPLADLQGPDIALAELEDLPGTLTMLQDVGLT
jgi:iron(III) transport system substrate-binding protein